MLLLSQTDLYLHQFISRTVLYSTACSVIIFIIMIAREGFMFKILSFPHASILYQLKQAIMPDC